MTTDRFDQDRLPPLRRLRRGFGRLAVAFAPQLVAKALGRPGPRRMPRLGLRRPVADALAPHVKHMADTGEGTDACLAQGALPLPVHFYSPVPDIADLDRRQVFQRRSVLGGVEMDVPAQCERLAAMGRRFGGECLWPHEPRPGYDGYITNASGFSFGCAAALHMMVRTHRPRRVIEVGSGWSSRVLAAAIARNAADGAAGARYTVVDPFPGDMVRRLPEVAEVLAERVETLPVEFFDELASGDVLFIDSGHTVRIGGDVNFLILDVLPRLKPGVLVHFHDIALPYEYSRSYVTNPAFRVFWTEAYLLQAFLAFNSAFEVLLAMNLLMLEHADVVRAALPAWDPEIHREISHSFWIRRCR